MRTCPRCRESKPFSDYNKNKANKNGIATYCRCCSKDINKIGRTKYETKRKEWIKNNQDYMKNWKLKNSTYGKDYYKKNAESIKNNRKKRYASNINFRIAHVLRCTIYRYIKNKNVKSTEIIGCDIESFKKYIEGRFKKNMSWENYGDWHIDHIIPLSSGKSYQELIELNHYTNLQPLWANENLSKGKAVF
jgi:hypothetical protein